LAGKDASIRDLVVLAISSLALVVTFSSDEVDEGGVICRKTDLNPDERAVKRERERRLP
jgi:hypothetical protein